MSKPSYLSDFEFASAARDLADALYIALLEFREADERSNRDLDDIKARFRHVEQCARDLQPFAGSRLIEMMRRNGAANPESWGIPFQHEIGACFQMCDKESTRVAIVNRYTLLLHLANAVSATSLSPEAGASSDGTARPAATKDNKRSRDSEKDARRGEARPKLIAALTLHHKYADGGCLNLEPIGNNALARLAKVDQSTASGFFKKEFKGHARYKTACADTASLIAVLKLLNNEFLPHVLLADRPNV